MQYRKILSGLLAILAMLACRFNATLVESAAPPVAGPAGQEQGTGSDPYLYERVECEQRELPVESECGVLTVLKNHSEPEGGTFRLPVTILKATGPNPDPDPVLLLVDSPGENTTRTIENWLESPVLRHRDLVLVELRGRGSLQPGLDCPELDQIDLSDTPAALTAAQACRTRLDQAGIDPAIFNSAQAASDLNVLRHALGIGEWNIVGVSYGARLALTLLRDYPQGIRSLILDSPYPPEVEAYEERAANAARALNQLFKDCARDQLCAYTYPDLRLVYQQMLQALDESPPELRIKNSETGELTSVILDGYTLNNLVLDALQQEDTAARIPYVIYAISYGNYEAIADLIHIQSQESQALAQAIAGLSDNMGLNLSIECREEIPFNSLETARETALGAGSPIAGYLLREVETLFAVCETWGAGKASDIENQPVKSDIPALILAGEYDQLTASTWGRISGRDLSNSFLYLFPRAGHILSDAGTCPQGIIADFLENPAEEPRRTCVDATQFQFYTP